MSSINNLHENSLTRLPPPQCRVTEHGLVRLFGWPHHPAGVPGGEEGPGFFRSQSAAADESEQQPQRGAPASPEGGMDRIDKTTVKRTCRHVFFFKVHIWPV